MDRRTPIPKIENLNDLEFLGTLKRLREKRDAFCADTRPLSRDEVQRLKERGNEAEDWGAIRVGSGFHPDHVSHSRFFGRCYLGACDGSTVDTGTSVQLPAGIHDSILGDTVLGDGCCVWHARGVSNYFVDDGAVLYNVGTLACSPAAVFGNGREIVIGIETGGREVLSFADMTVPIAVEVALRRETADAYRRFIAAYLEHVGIGYGVVGAGSRICNCPLIVDTLVGEGARCDNVNLVRDVTILSSVGEPTRIEDGAYVRHSCVQWGCHVSSMAIVDESVVTEHSHVERHGKVTHSIIGPNTGIAEGEVTASLVGPFVGFHHQALLIGALWPEGKGNVAYGANVGSNHTSKAPDQEIRCGEGVFFGLGASVKFPADYSDAPYSIIATGVTTLPQRVAFPFSLINAPSRRFEGVSPAYNELYPGWVLSDNLYAVQRNEAKYVKRNKARRAAFTAEVFRPEIIDHMVRARNALRAVSDVRDSYAGEDIPGIGKNVVTRQSLVRGVEVYSRYIEYYCLVGLFRFCRGRVGEVADQAVSQFLTLPASNERWEHERSLLMAEGWDRRPLHENLERLAQLVAQMTQAVVLSKEKDDVRGRAIMDDYDAAHAPAAEDAFVKETIARNNAWEAEIRELARRVRSS